MKRAPEMIFIERIYSSVMLLTVDLQCVVTVCSYSHFITVIQSFPLTRNNPTTRGLTIRTPGLKNVPENSAQKWI